MDRRERYNDPEESLRVALEGGQSKIWTALPGIVQSFDASRMVAVVQPAINGVVRDQNGVFNSIQLPLLLDCPVFFPSGGGVTLTFPVSKGDECLVVFASRCIDSWWAQGGIQGQAELRMHDLSDGFCLPGVRSQPRKFNVSTTGAQLRTDDGEAFIELDPSSHNVIVNTPGNVTSISNNATVNASGETVINSPQIILNGAVTVNGLLTYTEGMVGSGGTHAASITGDVVANGISLVNHGHHGVQPGSGNSGGPF